MQILNFIKITVFYAKIITIVYFNQFYKQISLFFYSKPNTYIKKFNKTINMHSFGHFFFIKKTEYVTQNCS